MLANSPTYFRIPPVHFAVPNSIFTIPWKALNNTTPSNHNIYLVGDPKAYVVYL